MTENGVIRVRSRRFLAHLNGTGEKPNFGLFFYSFFSFFGFFQHFPPYFSYLFPPKIIDKDLNDLSLAGRPADPGGFGGGGELTPTA